MNLELLAALDAQVGTPRKVFPWVTRASPDAIRHFALGVGDDNPLWWDEGYARASARGRMYAPPTFLYAAMSGGPWPDAEEDDADRLLPTVVLWSGDRWVWHDAPWLDEPLEADGEVVEISRRGPRVGGATRSGVGSVAKTDLTRFRGDGRRSSPSFTGGRSSSNDPPPSCCGPICPHHRLPIPRTTRARSPRRIGRRRSDGVDLFPATGRTSRWARRSDRSSRARSPPRT